MSHSHSESPRSLMPTHAYGTEILIDALISYNSDLKYVRALNPMAGLQTVLVADDNIFG